MTRRKKTNASRTNNPQRYSVTLRSTETTPVGAVLKYYQENKQKAATDWMTEAMTMAHLPFAYEHAGLPREEVVKITERTIWQLQGHIHQLRCAYLPETLDVPTVPLSTLSQPNRAQKDAPILSIPNGEPTAIEPANLPPKDAISGSEELNDYSSWAELLGVTAEDREVLETLCPFD